MDSLSAIWIIAICVLFAIVIVPTIRDWLKKNRQKPGVDLQTDHNRAETPAHDGQQNPREHPHNDEEDLGEPMVIHVEARNEEGFSGAEIIQFLDKSQLQLSKNGAYQYRVKGQLLFSVANGEEPGDIDQQFAEGRTRCMSFFFYPRPSHDPLQALKMMIQVAETMEHYFDGQVQDQHRSALTLQSKQHLHDLVAERTIRPS